MPKINFNVPLMDEKGEPATRQRIDKKKEKFDAATNKIVRQPVIDEDGFIVHDPVMVKDVLVELLNLQFTGDETVTMDEKVKRGRLARKVSDSTKGSYKNYSIAELEMIRTLAGKVAATSFLTTLSDLIDGTDNVQDDQLESKEQAA